VLHFDRERGGADGGGLRREVLVGALHAACIVVGEDFRFGHRAAGDVALLRTLVSGTASRSTASAWWVTETAGHRRPSARPWAAGDVEGAAVALGRPHRVEGPVVTGDRRGRSIGYPTANLELPADSAIPADGVYAGWLLHAAGAADEQRMPAAISIGTNPTFDGTVRRVEAYALDRDDLELYGEHVAVDFPCGCATPCASTVSSRSSRRCASTWTGRGRSPLPRAILRRFGGVPDATAS
jgi:riboflavin kinase/FMN adenylyltransferase